MDQASNAVFPQLRAGNPEALHGPRHEKPYNLLTRKTAAAITKIKNCRHVFPLGLPASKSSQTKRLWVSSNGCSCQLGGRSSTLMGMSPLLNKGQAHPRSEAIKRNESIKEKERKDDDHNNNNFKKKQVWKFCGKSSKK
jgi:hypothetical protein